MPYQIRILPVLFVLSFISGAAYGAPSCLKSVQDSAEELQRCLVNQREAGECDSLEAKLESIEKACSITGGSKRIEVARQIGIFRVPGDPSKSPYQQEQAYKREVRRLLDVNKDRYERFFGEVMPYNWRQMESGFDDRCDFAFAGEADNYVFLGYLVTRTSGDMKLPPGEGDQSITHLYFGKMERKYCFRPGMTEMTSEGAVPDYPDYVYNLHKTWIQTLPDEAPVVIRQEERGSSGDSPFRLKKPMMMEVREYPTFMEGSIETHVCSRLVDCLKKQEYYFEHYESYKNALTSYQEAKACVDYLDANETGEIDISGLFDQPCDKDTVRDKLKESKQKMEEEAKVLFPS